MLWVVIAVSLICSILGILLKKVFLSLYGVVFVVPLVLYLSGTPKFGLYILLLPLFQCASAYYVHHKKYWIAWLLLLPFIVLSGYLAYLVFFS